MRKAPRIAAASLNECLIGLGVSLALFALAAVLANRPRVPGKPRWIPWLAIMFAALLASLLLARHLFNLLGVNP